LYLVVSNSSPRSAYVRVTGTLVNVCRPNEGCDLELRNASGQVVDEAWNATTSDADLEFIDQKMFGLKRGIGAIAPVRVPPEYGGSIIGNSAFFEDTSTAISLVLFVQRNINPNLVSIGTVVTVIFQDGSKAQFRRTSRIGSLQWSYVQGSARAPNGAPIDLNGNSVNVQTAGTGSGGSIAGNLGNSTWRVDGAGPACMFVTRWYYGGTLVAENTQLVRCY
jgi:hypothetical protein